MVGFGSVLVYCFAESDKPNIFKTFILLLWPKCLGKFTLLFQLLSSTVFDKVNCLKQKLKYIKSGSRFTEKC